jgi:hypothetical protein
MEYRRLVEMYDRLDATSSTLEKTDILADTFDDAGELLPELTQLARGRLLASWESDDFGVSSSLTAQAIRDAIGIDDDPHGHSRKTRPRSASLGDSRWLESLSTTRLTPWHSCGNI